VEKMMLRKLPVLLVPLVLSYPAIGHGDESQPSNYDECIVGSLKGVSSDVAARAIIESCGNLFPRSQKEATPQAAPAPAPAPAATSEAPPPAAATPAARTAAPAEPAPLDTTRARDLSDDELALLRAKARVFGSTYRVTIENGNPNLTLTEVTIAVWDDADSAAGRTKYSEATEISPRNSAEVKYIVHYRGDETGWNWGVVGARGVE
jgi:hypothetical protein